MCFRQVADVLGVRIPWPVDGTSLVAPLPARVARRDTPARIYVDDATRVREFGPDQIAAGLKATVAWKLALFGTDAWPATRVPGTEGLVGRAHATLTIVRDGSGLRPRLARPLAFEDVDLGARVLPAQVTGWISRARARSSSPSRWLSG